MSDFNNETNFSHTPEQSASLKKGSFTIKKEGKDLVFLRKPNVILGIGGLVWFFCMFFVLLEKIRSDPGCALIFIMFAPPYLYFMIALLISKTETRVNSDLISIKTVPLPLGFPKSIPSKNVTQIYCKAIRHSGKNGSYTSYEVRAIVENGKEIVMDNYGYIDDAKVLEKTIEQYLGIKDQAVEGEASP